VKTKVLCGRCQSLLDSGEYSMLDVDVANALLSLGKELASLEYVRSYEIGDLVVIALRGVRKLSKASLQQMERSLESSLGRRVRIIEGGGSINELATQLVSPARILTISTSWLPDGTTETVVRITRSELRRLPFKPSELARVLSRISGSNIRVEIAK